MVRLVLKRAKATAGLEEGSGEPVVSNVNRHMPNLEIFFHPSQKTMIPAHFNAAIGRDFDAICSELLRFVETAINPLVSTIMSALSLPFFLRGSRDFLLNSTFGAILAILASWQKLRLLRWQRLGNLR